jgi:hypothetical protein
VQSEKREYSLQITRRKASIVTKCDSNTFLSPHRTLQAGLLDMKFRAPDAVSARAGSVLKGGIEPPHPAGSLPSARKSTETENRRRLVRPHLLR